MIIEWLFASIIGVIKTLFSIVPNLPSISSEILSMLTDFLSLIFDNLTLLGFFIRISTIKLFVPLIILVVNFEHVYKIIIWLIKKIPVSSE